MHQGFLWKVCPWIMLSSHVEKEQCQIGVDVLIGRKIILAVHKKLTILPNMVIMNRSWPSHDVVNNSSSVITNNQHVNTADTFLCEIIFSAAWYSMGIMYHPSNQCNSGNGTSFFSKWDLLSSASFGQKYAEAFSDKTVMRAQLWELSANPNLMQKNVPSEMLLAEFPNNSMYFKRNNSWNFDEDCSPLLFFEWKISLSVTNEGSLKNAFWKTDENVTKTLSENALLTIPLWRQRISHAFHNLLHDIQFKKRYQH